MIRFEPKEDGNFCGMMIADGKEAAIYDLSKLHGMIEIIDKHGILYITTPSSITLIKKILVEEVLRCQKYIEKNND